VLSRSFLGLKKMRTFKLLSIAIFVSLVSSPVTAKEILYTVVTVFSYPKDSGNFVQVQGHTEMTKKECETQIFLLSDNKDANLPFGRSSKWEIVGGDAKLENGKIVVSRWESNESNFSFLCVPTGW
jgi:hypothetical protein|tara:strand:+ start:80 stop:457 length:378 start_codon:yes stop_codon:yes gene_type:complete